MQTSFTEEQLRDPDAAREVDWLRLRGSRMAGGSQPAALGV